MATKIRLLLLEKGLEVGDIADYIRYSLSGASRIVNGKRPCPPLVAQGIAEMLGSSTRKLFVLEDDDSGWYRAKEKVRK